MIMIIHCKGVWLSHRNPEISLRKNNCQLYKGTYIITPSRAGNEKPVSQPTTVQALVHCPKKWESKLEKKVLVGVGSHFPHYQYRQHYLFLLYGSQLVVKGSSLISHASILTNFSHRTYLCG